MLDEEKTVYDRSVPQYKLFQELILAGSAKIKQSGLGIHSICARCNSFLGRNYCNDYIPFCWQVYWNFFRSVEPTINLPYYFHPLRLVKQVVSMFLAIDTNQILADREELVHFVMNRSKRGLPSGYKVFCYVNKVGLWRRNAYSFVWSGKTDVMGKMLTSQMSEITQPPLGFLLLKDYDDSDKRLIDISDFGSYRINDWKEVYLSLPVLSTYSGNMPNMYPSKEQLDSYYEKKL